MPSKPESGVTNRRRAIFVSDSLWEKIADAAAKDQRTRSSWIRAAIVSTLTR